MLNKTLKEINDFSLNIKTIKSHDDLLNYMNSGFYSSIKLLISVSPTFSIYWKVVFPFIVSLSALFILSNIELIGEALSVFMNINYILAILLCLVFITLAYSMYCKKYFISCVEKSKSIMGKG